MILCFFAYLGKTAVPTSLLDIRPVLVIDPGHGGYDHGALGIDGTPEAELNLSISQKLECIAEFTGIKSIMTRTDDTPRTTREKYSEHEDLVYRTEIANHTRNAMMICIHQNTYPSELISGVQVLYSDNDASAAWGTLTHNNLLTLLDTENRRVAQPAPEKLYITSNTNCPTLLVECGFISNNKDLNKLKDYDYQTCFATVLAASFMQYVCGSRM